MTHPVHDDADTSGVSASGDHADVAGLELDEVHNLVGGDVNPDGVVDLDQGVGVTDGPAVVGGQHGDVVGADGDLEDAAQLVLGLLAGDPVHAEPAKIQPKLALAANGWMKSFDVSKIRQMPRVVINGGRGRWS